MCRKRKKRGGKTSPLRSKRRINEKRAKHALRQQNKTNKGGHVSSLSHNENDGHSSPLDGKDFEESDRYYDFSRVSEDASIKKQMAMIIYIQAICTFLYTYGIQAVFNSGKATRTSQISSITESTFTSDPSITRSLLSEIVCLPENKSAMTDFTRRILLDHIQSLENANQLSVSDSQHYKDTIVINASRVKTVNIENKLRTIVFELMDKFVSNLFLSTQMTSTSVHKVLLDPASTFSLQMTKQRHIDCSQMLRGSPPTSTVLKPMLVIPIQPLELQVLYDKLKIILDMFKENGMFQDDTLSRHNVEFTESDIKALSGPIPLYRGDSVHELVHGYVNEHMAPEAARLRSFVFWPLACMLSIQSLVDAGFYSTDAGLQIVDCFSCGLSLRISDLNGRNPRDVHTERSPDCHFLQSLGASDRNIPQNGSDFTPLTREVMSESSRSVPEIGSCHPERVAIKETIDRGQPVDHLQRRNERMEIMETARKSIQNLNIEDTPSDVAQPEDDAIRGRAVDLPFTSELLPDCEGQSDGNDTLRNPSHDLSPKYNGRNLNIEDTPSDVAQPEDDAIRGRAVDLPFTSELLPDCEGQSDGNDTLRNPSHDLSPKYNGIQPEDETSGVQQAVEGATAAVNSIASSQNVEGYNSISLPPSNPLYEQLMARTASFATWTGRHNSDSLVEAGLFYTGDEDVVRCYQCDIGLAEWNRTDDPWKEHARHSPECCFLLQNKGQAYVDAIQREWALVYSPKCPELSHIQNRMDTFRNWPGDFVVQTPRQLAVAGFHYTGVTDTVRCHYCDGGLREWEPHDVPWVEHAKWFPQCKFVLKIKGQQFIRQCVSRRNEPQPNQLEEGDAPTTEYRPTMTYADRCRIQEEENPMYTAAAQAVINMGYTTAMVSMSINTFIARTGARNFRAKDLMEIILDKEEGGADGGASEDTSTENSEDSISNFQIDTRALLKERDILREAQVCVICGTRDRCMVFVPCGHRITCQQCSTDQTRCSHCNSPIENSVHTFLA